MNKKLVLSLGSLALSLGSYGQFWNFSEPTKLGGSVNQAGTEESIPVFSKDSSVLYFTRTYDPSNKGGEMDQDIWFSKQDGVDSYTDCARVTELNNKFNNAVLGINKSGTTMYLLHAYDGKKDMQKGLAKSVNDGGKWGTPEEVVIPGLDIDGDYYGFHVSEDESVIIISYNGPGSLGEEDLYVSTKTGDTWSTPQHMGSTINSTGYEISPFLSPSKDTLYFSSNGMGGEGDADIFYSVKQGSWTSWSKAVNLGPKINSSKFDAYFIHSDKQAYWSSNRDSELSDIWMVNILTPPAVSITCSSMDATTYQGADGSIDATVSGGVAPYTFAWSNGTTTEDASGLMKGEYSVTVTDAIGQTASTSCSVDEPNLPPDISMKHYFTYNAHKLSTDDGELNKFVTTIDAQLTQGRESVTIVVNSSASKVRTRTFQNNQKLAQTRAEDIKKVLEDYFAGKGTGSKVKVTIDQVQVQGPDYKGDFEETSKYEPFQYIELKTK